MNSFSFPAEILKSGDGKDGRIPVTIIPNQPTKDRVNDKILLKAFDDDCIKGFLHDGIIDYDHLSLLSEDPIIKAQAIIGEPENLFVDSKRNVPVCEAFLFESNPFVSKSILPALMSKSKVFGASLGGKILMKSFDYDPETRKRGMEISKMTLKHIAITPLQKAVHQGTTIQLRKSLDEGSTAEEFDFSFPSFSDFIKSMGSVDYFMKALEAGNATDISGLSGGQAVQRQSLEGDKIDLKKIRSVMPFVVEGILKGQISGGYNSFKTYLIKRGLTEQEAGHLAKVVAINAHKIVKLIF